LFYILHKQELSFCSHGYVRAAIVPHRRAGSKGLVDNLPGQGFFLKARISHAKIPYS